MIVSLMIISHAKTQVDMFKSDGWLLIQLLTISETNTTQSAPGLIAIYSVQAQGLKRPHPGNKLNFAFFSC